MAKEEVRVIGREGRKKVYRVLCDAIQKRVNQAAIRLGVLRIRIGLITLDTDMRYTPSWR